MPQPFPPPTADDVASALSSLDPGATRQEWIQIGMALHEWDDVQGLELWEQWSATSGKYKPGECERCWRGFQPGSGTTINTLYGLARQAGWQRGDPAPASPPTRATAPPAAPKKRWFAETYEEARAKVKRLPRAAATPQAVAFLAGDYGLPHEAITPEWRWFEHPRLGPGIIYVSRTPEGGIVFKFRSHSRDEKGKRRTDVLWGEGPACLDYPREGQPLVITGGEEKAAAAHAAGFGALSRTFGEAGIPADWAALVAQRNPPAVILAHDADDAGAKANQRTAELLERAGYPKGQIHTLRWPAGSARGWDLNDHLKQGGDLHALLQGAIHQPERLSVVSLSDLESMEFDPRDAMMHDKLLIRGGLMAVFGVGGTGKSRLVQQLAICCTLGLDWLDVRTYCPGSKWLILQTENDPERIKRETLAQLDGMLPERKQIVARNIRWLAPMKDIDSEVNLAFDGAEARLRSEVLAFQPDVVVFDPLAEFFAGNNENEASQMHDTVRRLMRIARAASIKTATIIVHHGSGGGAAQANAVGINRSEFGRGSKAIYNRARSAINVAMTEEEGELVIACGKNNNGRRFDPRGVRLSSHRMWYEVDRQFNLEEWQASCSGKKKSKALIDPSMILVRMPEGDEISQTVLMDEVRETHKVSPSVLRDMIRKLVAEGRIQSRTENYGGGRRYYLRRVGGMTTSARVVDFTPSPDDEGKDEMPF